MASAKKRCLRMVAMSRESDSTLNHKEVTQNISPITNSSHSNGNDHVGKDTEANATSNKRFSRSSSPGSSSSSGSSRSSSSKSSSRSSSSSSSFGSTSCPSMSKAPYPESDKLFKSPSNHDNSEDLDFIENTPPHPSRTNDKVKDRSANREKENIPKSTIGTLFNLIPYSPSSSENEYNKELPTQLSPSNQAILDAVDFTERSSSPNNIKQGPAVSRELDRAANTNYVMSPVYSDESDVDLSDNDPTYVCSDLNQKIPRNYIFPASSSDTDTSTKNCKSNIKSRKRQKNTTNWKQNKAKRLRNKGGSYTSLSKTRKSVPNLYLKPPCTERCKYKCTEKIDTNARYNLFNSFWELGDLYKQRAFITSCMVDIQPKYKYTNVEKPRNLNKAYYFTVSNEKIRVCKWFFKSTLDISERMVYTTQQKITDGGFIEEDFRGKHGNHKKLSKNLVTDIKEYINSIPRLESHYVRATTSREYIDGGKNIRDLYADFEKQQKINNKEIGNYMA